MDISKDGNKEGENKINETSVLESVYSLKAVYIEDEDDEQSEDIRSFAKYPMRGESLLCKDYLRKG